MTEFLEEISEIRARVESLHAQARALEAAGQPGADMVASDLGEALQALEVAGEMAVGMTAADGHRDRWELWFDRHVEEGQSAEQAADGLDQAAEIIPALVAELAQRWETVDPTQAERLVSRAVRLQAATD